MQRHRSLRRGALFCGATLAAAAGLSCSFRDLSYLQSGLGGSTTSATTTSATTTGATTSSQASSSGAGGQGTIQPDPTLPVLPCGGTRCSDPAMIADFESNDGQVCPTAGRAGYGLIFNDGTGDQWPIVTGNPSTQFSPLPACRGESAVGFHTKGANFTSWGAGMDIHFADHGWDASAYSGITFWAKSSTSASVRIGVSSLGTQDVSYGGTCVPQGGKQCNDHFSTTRKITPSWMAYPVTFSELQQAGWGVPASTPTIDATGLIEIQFVFAAPEAFDFWLDDTSFSP